MTLPPSMGMKVTRDRCKRAPGTVCNSLTVGTRLPEAFLGNHGGPDSARHQLFPWSQATASNANKLVYLHCLALKILTFVGWAAPDAALQTSHVMHICMAPSRYERPQNMVTLMRAEGGVCAVACGSDWVRSLLVAIGWRRRVR